jgi:hypothetical protein
MLGDEVWSGETTNGRGYSSLGEIMGAKVNLEYIQEQKEGEDLESVITDKILGWGLLSSLMTGER